MSGMFQRRKQGFHEQQCLSAVREITIAHSPDSDDAFMFYALATNKIRVPGLRFTHTLCDIETLNRKAMEGDGATDVPRAFVSRLPVHSKALRVVAERG